MRGESGRDSGGFQCGAGGPWHGAPKRVPFRAVLRRNRAVLLVVACVAACATQRVGRTKLPDGTFKLECRKGLAECLTDLTKDICRDYGYEVVGGKEVVERIGVEPVNSINVSSEAIVRCRSSGALVTFDKAPAVASTKAAPAAPGRCFPGATQACLGPGACKGAQTCVADGKSFSACDCGGAPPAAVPAPAPEAPATIAPAPVLDGGAP